MFSPFRSTERSFFPASFMEREFDRLLHDSADHVSAPLASLYENDISYLVELEGPGCEEADMHVTVQREALEVRGERKKRVPEGYTFRGGEKAAPGKFIRKFALDLPVETDGVSATMKDGLLSIVIPKAKDARPREVVVKGAHS